MKKPLSHVYDYILLCSVLVILIFFLIFYNGSPDIQKIIVILATAWYVGWGYFHHSKDGSHDLSVIVEYLLYGILGGALVIGLL